MDPFEKQALLGLLGAVYGETKKMDQLIVGESKDLKRTSDNIKGTFTNVLHHNTQPHPTQPLQTPPVATQQVAYAPQPQYIQPQTSVVATDSTLVEISKKLDTIISLLEQKAKPNKKKNATKPSKNIIETISKLCVQSKHPEYSESFGEGTEHSN